MNRAELIAHCDRQDQNDDLAALRDEFELPTDDNGKELTYLCGNSLGLQPQAVESLLMEELNDWRKLGVEGHFHARRPWMPYHEQLTSSMAAMVGAQQDEVVCMNSLTVNLHLMMVSFYHPTHQRNKILIESGAFPSDRYAVESQLIHHGFDASSLLELEPNSGETCLRTEDIEKTLEEFGHEIALVLLPGVQYYSGQVFEIERITKAAHEVGCTVGWDLAHSVGNVPLAMHNNNADFAVWCNYKYMNSGPGSIAGCFVHERHCKNPDINRFAGWWGHDKNTRFQMGPHFKPIPTAEGWQLSNPPIFAMTPLIASLAVFQKTSMQALNAKSLSMGRVLIEHLQQHFADSVNILTPLDDAQRGGQLSLQIQNLGGGGGKTIQQNLIDAGVICDWREPDCIRIAFAPLYNRYSDIYNFTEVLDNTLSKHA